jgi:hypothetical protein
VITLIGIVGLLVSILGVLTIVLPFMTDHPEVLWPEWREPGGRRVALGYGVKGMVSGLALCLPVGLLG